MTQSEKLLSNLSYTNKDFESIFPELLDLAKKISYKWDPSTSDESDPGVVLLKICALMADKNNYNIDKSVLELYPLSVTQLASAREIFDQCGYTMKYYRSATTTITMSMKSKPSITDDEFNALAEGLEGVNKDSTTLVYKIPKFTMISDADKSTVYTLTEDVNLEDSGELTTANAIEGTIVDYDINGEKTIIITNLDYNNRIYFPTTDIAENGIFIRNSNQQSTMWKKVDNLTIQPAKTLCYKFGLTRDGFSCYIEFPSDIADIIGEGLNISYIRTSGSKGNISRKQLTRFFNDLTVERSILGSSNVQPNVELNNDNVYIVNNYAATSGEDPESIESAYRNYQKIKQTFDTLVSVKDYENYLYLNEYISNGFVCDRANDIDCSYKVLEADSSKKIEHTMFDKDRMTAFDLKIYGFKFVDPPATFDAYKKSFELIADNQTSIDSDYYFLTRALKDTKCIAHDYKEITANKIACIKNKYCLQIKIIPQYALTDYQQLEVKNNVYLALYKKLYSRVINFGDDISYSLIYDTIIGSDPRIKAINLDPLTYKTYAVYVDENRQIQEKRIDSNFSSAENLTKAFKDEVVFKSILGGRTNLLYPESAFTQPLIQSNSEIYHCDHITTKTVINIKYDNKIGTSDTLKTNENIYITAPNYVTDKTYGSGVIYVATLNDNKVVSKSADYTLQDSEYIIFFWKPDNDSTSYTYKKYEKGNVIKPSFNLKSNKPTTFDDNVKLGTSISGTIEDDYIKTLVNKSNNVLSGTSTIIVEKLNTVDFSSSKITKIFWILNNTPTKNKSGEQYQTLFDVNETERTLQDGEYLIYPNITGTQIVLLEAGTLITRDKNSAKSKWECSYKSWDDLFKDGNPIDNLNNNELWYTIPSDAKLFATEMTYYQLGAGARLKLDATNIKNNSETESLIDEITNEFLSLKNYKIFYYSSPSADEVALPLRNGDNDSWKVQSILNIDASPSRYQELQSNQSIIFLSKNSDTTNDVNLSDCKFYVDTELQLVGGTNIDVRSRDQDGNLTVPLGIMKYTLPTSIPGGVQIKPSTTFITLKELSPVTIKTTLQEGDYYMRVTIPDDVKVTININDTTESTELNSEGKKGSYYYSFNSKGNEISLKFSTTGPTNITVDNLLKYDLDKSKYINTTDILKTTVEKIKEKDTERYFNYIYQLDDNNEIKDPLDSYSFFDKRHIYNKFTIAEWDVANSSIQILNNLK